VTETLIVVMLLIGIVALLLLWGAVAAGSDE
jgi:hypothetical protein